MQEGEHGHDFGTLLKVLRVSKQVRQTTIVALLPGWSRTSYTRLENGELPPHFDQLYALYRAFHLAGISFTPEARQQFLDFARVQIHKKKTHLDKHTDTEWAELRYQLALLDGSASTLTEELTHHSSSVVHRPLLAETSHLLGREEWHEHLLSLLITSDPKKVLIIRGPAGIGKSSELNWLATYLFRQRLTPYRVILCDFRSLERIGGPEEAFEVFLGTLLTELGYVQSQATLPSWEERTMLILEQLEKGVRPTVLLLDHSECILHASGVLAACWERFLTKFLRSKHLTTLVFATKQWPGWYEGEQQFVAEIPLPPLSREKGVLVLQHLGLEHILVTLLQDIYARTGGIPLCLEWVTALVKQPLFADDWEEFTTLTRDNESDAPRTMIDAIHRLLQEPHLFGGPVADELAPFLERILSTQRLSSDANALLQTLSVATLPLAKPALQVLCLQGSRPLKELRRASVLVAYPDRAQLLPMVAAAMYRRLSPEQIHAQETLLLQAYKIWQQNETFHEQEEGKLITELAMLLLIHHHLLEAAEFLIRYGWLSFNLGHAPRLAQLAESTLKSFDWRKTEADKCGALILRYFLPPFLGKRVDSAQQFLDYQYIHKLILAEKLILQPSTQIHVALQLMIDLVGKASFQEAEILLNDCYSQLYGLFVEDKELQVSLLEKQAWLFGKWSEYAEEQGYKENTRDYQEQAISLYKQCYLILSKYEVSSLLKRNRLKKRLARVFNNLAYHLNRVKRYEEAITCVEQGIILKEQGYVEFDGLAASYGQKSEILVELGRFQEALFFDEKAFAEVERLALTGHTSSREERWIYVVNRGRLYLRLGRVLEAEQLLRQALSQVPSRRRSYSMFAKDALEEIDNWRQSDLSSHYQLDWRWVERYRQLDSYDAYWWLAYAGPFTQEEQCQWEHLFRPSLDEDAKARLGVLLAHSRERELATALAEQREPHLSYPTIDIEEVKARITAFLELDADIQQNEPNMIVRHLYHGAIEDEVAYLGRIQATYEGNSERFWELSRHLFPEPTREEMDVAFTHVWNILQQGIHSSPTEEASQFLLQFLHERLHLSQKQSRPDRREQERQQKTLASSPQSQEMLSPQAVKLFFEAVFRESGYEGWKVTIDTKTSAPRVESGLRQVFIGNSPLSLHTVRHYFSHELLGHVARAIAGEHSPLGLLGINTKNYAPTEEGLALYHERQIATLHGQEFADTGLWLGTLAVGLACGACTPPQSFLALCTFLESFFFVKTLLAHPEKEPEEVRQRARKTALTYCLRVFRGVPDLTKPGICYTKDGIYLRGLQMIEQAVAEDEGILDRLAVGRVALELLPYLQELGILIATQPLRKRAYDPDLDSYIVSFERYQGEKRLS